MESYYSIGTRDPFRNHTTPIWLRFNKVTGQFAGIAERLDRSGFRDSIVISQGHVWLPLEVPRHSDRNAMIASLVGQVRDILEAAYGTRGDEDIDESVDDVRS